MKRLRIVLPVAVLILAAAYLAIPIGAQTGFASQAFQSNWERTDKAVAEGQRVGTWIWGPNPNSGGMQEDYVEGSLADGTTGKRLVQYFDKSRMEITNPNGDSSSIWFVTNGLLATEMITGQMQTGDNSFVTRKPAQVNVAGDANDPNGPTYATFNGLLNVQPLSVSSGFTLAGTNTVIMQRVDRAGNVTNDPSLAARDIRVALVDDVTNHSIAMPFWDFMNSSGTIYENGQYVQGQLFANSYFATGRPIIEPYWADVLVGGQQKLVLIQCFERRCLTYTPDNASEWRVEMGNIGQHYFTWRYVGAMPPGGGQPTATPTPPGGGAQPTATSTPPGGGGDVAACLDQAESEFLAIINQYRAQNNLPPLAASAALNTASYNHSLDMGQRGYFSHDTPEGTTPGQRAQAAGYNGLVAENIAAGNESAQATFEQWRTSPGHNANMLSNNVVIGIGRASVAGSQFQWYWTTMFGNVADNPPNCP